MVDKPESRFDADLLMKRACASAKLDDYGDTRFVEPLREYLAGAARYFPFTAAGAARLADGIVNQLVNRLRMTEDLKRHPEILEEDVSDPIVITGMPRTGTTKLQRVLSADTANQSLLYWKVINFARFPDAAPGAPDPRIAVAKAACDQIATANPEVMTGHPFLHDQAEEDCLILDGTYEHFQNAGAVNDERYCAYVQSRPRDNAYRYLHMVLQYLQWQDGGKRGPWVLKSPVHMGYLPEVLSTFPDATIVQGHRDSVAVFGSLCHLVSDLIQPMSWARLDPHQTGRDLLRVWGDAWDQNQANRAALPPDSRFIDIDYEEIKDDSIAVAERIYAVTGRRLDDAGRTAIAQWEKDNRKDRFGRHEYELEEYGVSPAEVEERFRLRTPMRRGQA